ncbi:ubiquitin-like protein ATG12 [Lineus longissimus]|uniref:ubiquitin-like protein ATG12 n=1 Tax=Lineus longissimus TaxID=88925 RepID=UPI002B4EA82C
MADTGELDDHENTEGQNEPPSSHSGTGTGSATSSPSAVGQTKAKIDVLLKATGDAPIMKKKKWAVDPTKKVCWIIEFIKKYIKCEAPDSVFLYVNQSFCPSPDTEIGAVYDCFGSDGKLILHYCKTQAWG